MNCLNQLPFTGERMVPFHCPQETEAFHWQKYLFFREWYEDANVIDAGCGEGYGANYASTFAKIVVGIDTSPEVIDWAEHRYPNTTFVGATAERFDYSDADVVLAFDLIQELEDPNELFDALAKCTGKIVISTPNRLCTSDALVALKLTRKWSSSDFAELVKARFADRPVRFLSQDAQAPGLLKEGVDDSAASCLAVIGADQLPSWPAIGFAIPTHNNWSELYETMITLSRTYPGEICFAVTANGCNAETINAMRNFQATGPLSIEIIEREENEGFGVGCNLALGKLREGGHCDYYGVINDDVIPTTDCVCEMVVAMEQLERAGLTPGVVGPVSNAVNGKQEVEIGGFTDFKSLIERADEYHRRHHSSVTQVVQLRGLCMVIHPRCLEAVGGFDPIFGIGNFEDDDHNLRCRLAGYSLWIADGAFLYHRGSSTFRRLGVDYAANIEQNCSRMMRKWKLDRLEDWLTMALSPEGVSLRIPLETEPIKDRFEIQLNGEALDLISEATEVEFAGWVMYKLKDQPRQMRQRIIELLEEKKSA